MKSQLVLGVIGALLTGVLIALQAALSNRSGQVIGPIRTGLATNMIGGGVALILTLILAATRVLPWEENTRQVAGLLVTAGIMGIFIIMGVSFSLRFAGVLAGLGAIILGQMAVSAVVDAVGWGGLARVPLTPQRIAGLLLMAVSVYLLLPRK